MAGLPAVVGLGAASYQQPDMFNSGFHKAAIVCAVLLLAGSALSATLIRSDVLRAEPVAGSAAPSAGLNCPLGRAAAGAGAASGSGAQRAGLAARAAGELPGRPASCPAPG